MKKNKMSLTTELDLTREGTAEMTRWCILIALHQSFGIGAARLNKILDRAEKLGQESQDEAKSSCGGRATWQLAWSGRSAPKPAWTSWVSARNDCSA